MTGVGGPVGFRVRSRMRLSVEGVAVFLRPLGLDLTVLSSPESRQAFRRSTAPPSRDRMCFWIASFNGL